MKIKSTSILACLLLTISCNSKSNSHQVTNKNAGSEHVQSSMETQNLSDQIAELKNSMTDYIPNAHMAYNVNDVDECVNILNRFVIEMTISKSKEEGLQLVKATILQLNALNKKCGDILIETDQREMIAAIIVTAGNKKGYNTMDDDITEKWREW